MRKTGIVCKGMILLSVVYLLTGCWDREEIEDRSYVIGLGLDKSEHKGKIKVTMLLANPEVGSMQGGGGSNEKPREIITFDVNDMIAAKGTANSIISRTISYEFLRIIIVSEKYAKDKNFPVTIIDTQKDKEIRMNTYLAVSRENASDYFVKNKPMMETRPHKYFQYMVDHGIENGMIPDSTLFRYFKTLDRGTDLYLAMYTTAIKSKNTKVKSEDEYIAGQVDATGELDDTQFIGSAVFKNGIMTKKLTGQETRIVNVLDDTTDIKDILIDIPDPFSNKRRQFAARIMKRENNKVKMKNLKGTKPQVIITIPLKVEIMTNPSMVSYTSKKNRQILKKQVISFFKEMNESLFKKSQTKLKGVPYPLPLYARPYFLTNKEFEKFDWEKSFLRADIIVKPEVEIIDYGKQTKKTVKKGG
ncbi:Ger(x)C family spore germination protein [Bacillus sp. ISL-18]|uniref:Ger(x)C family spore germination protein n=1 Tax=Bacillus sp. ISL-18 TaxID=2819118 RepID=UPI001BE52461|nr:Ger(x)C family spore germination protein [Bacillus sp. ISL-18]MBT2654956.1 Ger(x)C family spore germination protein [Bacillus sp. ISL-18]